MGSIDVGELILVVELLELLANEGNRLLGDEQMSVVEVFQDDFAVFLVIQPTQELLDWDVACYEYPARRFRHSHLSQSPNSIDKSRRIHPRVLVVYGMREFRIFFGHGWDAGRSLLRVRGIEYITVTQICARSQIPAIHIQSPRTVHIVSWLLRSAAPHYSSIGSLVPYLISIHPAPIAPYPKCHHRRTAPPPSSILCLVLSRANSRHTIPLANFPPYLPRRQLILPKISSTIILTPPFLSIMAKSRTT